MNRVTARHRVDGGVPLHRHHSTGASATRALALLAALMAGCATTPESTADADPNALRPWQAGLEGCKVSVDTENGRSLACGPILGAVVLARRTESAAMIDAFLDGVGRGAGVDVHSEPADASVGGTVTAGRHAWLTNKAGLPIDGWLGVVTTGGERKLVGCFKLGEPIGDRCSELLPVLRDLPMITPGVYPLDVLGAHAPSADGCHILQNRASCGSYEMQWYDDGASLTVERFVERFVANGNTVTAREALGCTTHSGEASCAMVSLDGQEGAVDVYFAYPQAGGVLLCIVEHATGLQPQCRAFMTLKEG